MSSTSTTWSTDANTSASGTGSTTQNVSLDGTLTVAGDLTVSSPGVYKGYMPWIITSAATGASTGTESWIPFMSNNEGANTNSDLYRGSAPYAGYLEKIVFKVNLDANTVGWRLYKAPSGTAVDDLDQSAQRVGDEVEVETGTVHGQYTATFGTSYSFAAGDGLAVSVNPESAPNDLNISLIFRVLVD